MVTLKKLLLVFFLPVLVSRGAFALSEPEKMVYIFGFGSLMSTPARTATEPDPKGSVYIPVKVKGYTRDWQLWMPRSQQRSLELEQALGGYVNGLIFAVKKSELPKFDRREGPAYQRKQLPADHIIFYREEDRSKVMGARGDMEVYAYFPDKSSSYYVGRGDDTKKIAMSYLKVVLTGCIEVDQKNNLGGKFTDDCAATMGLADYKIEDDTKAPRYSRFPPTLLKEAKIREQQMDKYISSDWPNYLEAVRKKWGF